jgi:glycosyltransferase involved in cell wall biosynthesis
MQAADPDKPAVTVVTATWGRPKTIMRRAIPSVAAQDYPGRIEHLIVTDGYDEDLNRVLFGAGYTFGGHRRRLVNLGRNWSAPEVVHGGVGTIPKLVGAWMAAGEYICYLDDDNEYLPHHVSALVSALESSGADFATSRWQQHYPGGKPGGCSPPGRRATDTSGIMHRASVLPRGAWQIDGYEADGALAERWIAAGCTWAFVEEPTFVLYWHRKGAPDDPEDEE